MLAQLITQRIIELGGGNQPQYHPNYDIRELPNVDRVIDFNKPLPIPDSSYDLVFSKYCIEHINWRNMRQLLKEIYRILAPNGRIKIITANLLEQAKVLVNNPDNIKWNDYYLGMIFGDEDYSENTHRCGFSPNSITKILTEIGFKNINITPIYSDFGPTDMVVEAIKGE